MTKTKVAISTEDLATVTEAAKVLGVHFATIYRRVQKGKIVGIRLGNTLYIPKSELERLRNE